MQSSVTLRPSRLRTVQVIVTVSPSRTGALKVMLAPEKIVPAPGKSLPITAET
jgi:hypothetical protein